jgi:hypothetical protein
MVFLTLCKPQAKIQQNDNHLKKFFFLDTTPPVIGCPGDIFVTASQLQTTSVVSWTEPSAHDAKDGYVA